MDRLTRMPAVFVSHGSPMLAVQDSPAGRFLDGSGAHAGMGAGIRRLDVRSACAQPGVGAAARPVTVHDFAGFPAQLHDITYPAPGDPPLAEALAALLRDAGLQSELLPGQGLDHGVWVPLRRMYPRADIRSSPSP